MPSKFNYTQIQGQFEELDKTISQQSNIINVLVVVLFIGFAASFIAVGGYIMQYMANKQATYQTLIDKINSLEQSNSNLSKNDIIIEKLEAIESGQINKLTCTYQKNGLSCQP